MTNKLNRRSFFKTAAATSLLPAAGGIAAFSPISFAAEAPKQARTLEEITAMSPIDMARESEVVQTAYRLIASAADRLKNPELRKIVKDLSLIHI